MPTSHPPGSLEALQLGFLIPILTEIRLPPPPNLCPSNPNHCLPTVPPDLPNAHGLAVDWVSRNLFWTSYDTNKKQINVARLDGSFKNAVVQGLEQPHGLVVHPIRGWVPGPGLGSVRCRWGKKRTLSLPSPHLSLPQEALLDRWRQHQHGQYGRQQPHPALQRPEGPCGYALASLSP